MSTVRTLHGIGDSHIKTLRHLGEAGRLSGTRIECCVVEGATAMGVTNPNSQTRSGPTIRAYLDEVDAEDDRLFCLGEVDCGFVIWHRAQRRGESVENQLDRAIDNYTSILETAGDPQRIVALSAPPPTILDGQNWGEVANLRSEVTATLAERTDLTQRFNRRLQEVCQTAGYRFIDFAAELIDPETGVIDDRYRHDDPCDHHLNPDTATPILERRLREIGFD